MQSSNYGVLLGRGRKKTLQGKTLKQISGLVIQGRLGTKKKSIKVLKAIGEEYCTKNWVLKLYVFVNFFMCYA